MSRFGYVVTVDIGLTNDRTAVAVSHVEDLEVRDPMTGDLLPDGQRIVCDELVYFEGTRSNPVRLAEVEETVVQLARRYGHARVVFDPYQAASLSQNIKRRGFNATPFHFSAGSKQKLASTAINFVSDRAWSLPGELTLVEELRGLRVVEKTNGMFAIDHTPGGHDDGFMACVLGAHHLLENRPARLRSHGYRRPPRDGIPDETDPDRFEGLGEREWIRAAQERRYSQRDHRLAGRR